MKTPEQIQYHQAHSLIQKLNQNMVGLAALLKGQISPTEQTLLANVFEAQIELQLLLDEMGKQANRRAADTEKQESEAGLLLDTANSLTVKI